MKVVIIGGGFGGVQAALSLDRAGGFDVRLVSNKPYFEYHAALYRSATGRSPLEVAIPLADIFRETDVEVLEDRIERIDAEAKTVTGKSGSVYRYDALVVAVGTVTSYFGIAGLAENSLGIKTIHEALELRRHIHDQALSGTAEHYVVVGAGMTGIEVAGEIGAYVARIQSSHGLPDARCSVDLVEAGSRILPAMPEPYARRVHDRLEELGVSIRTDTRVEAETYSSLQLPDGTISSHVVVWTAGSTTHPLVGAHPSLFRLDAKGRVLVNERLEASPGIYVVGDSASTPFSGMAQTALHDARFVAVVLRAASEGKQPPRYEPKRPLYALPVGPGWAAVLIGSYSFFGRIGWILRRLADFRLYLAFVPLLEAIRLWRYGRTRQEGCAVCTLHA